MSFLVWSVSFCITLDAILIDCLPSLSYHPSFISNPELLRRKDDHGVETTDYLSIKDVGSVAECSLECQFDLQCVATNFNLTQPNSYHGDQYPCVLLPAITTGDMWLTPKQGTVYAYRGMMGS